MARGRPIIDLTGKRFFRLKVIKAVGRTKHGSVLWLCQCKCGNMRNIESGNLRHQIHPVKSCGCYRLEFLARCSRSRKRRA